MTDVAAVAERIERAHGALEADGVRELAWCVECGAANEGGRCPDCPSGAPMHLQTWPRAHAACDTAQPAEMMTTESRLVTCPKCLALLQPPPE